MARQRTIAAKNGGMILYLAADLLWASKIKGAADALAIPCRPVRTMEMLEARLAEAAAVQAAGSANVGSAGPGDQASIGSGTMRRPGPEQSASDLRALLLDLDKPEEAMAMIARMRREERWRGVRLVCFGPHVAKELFQQARDAGADEVMPRGALDARLDEVMVRLEAGGRV